MTDRGIEKVAAYVTSLQERLAGAFEQADGSRAFRRLEIPGERGGLARPWLLEGGDVIERAAVNVSLTRGALVPASLAERRGADAAGRLDAASISVIVHPRNPHAPTAHLNLRRLAITGGGASAWFGGGLDLTPSYGYEEDAALWHRAAREACAPLGDAAWRAFKQACDDYYRLPHRDEARGIGGLFFDDLDTPDFETCFAFVRRLGEMFEVTYLAILDRRAPMTWNERERAFQRLRRGRYVEFNLLHDRGTRFGLEAGVRTESVLAALPPDAAWGEEMPSEPGSRERELVERFLVPRDWI